MIDSEHCSVGHCFFVPREISPGLEENRLGFTQPESSRVRRRLRLTGLGSQTQKSAQTRASGSVGDSGDSPSEEETETSNKQNDRQTGVLYFGLTERSVLELDLEPSSYAKRLSFHTGK